MTSSCSKWFTTVYYSVNQTRSNILHFNWSHFNASWSCKVSNCHKYSYYLYLIKELRIGQELPHYNRKFFQCGNQSIGKQLKLIELIVNVSHPHKWILHTSLPPYDVGHFGSIAKAWVLLCHFCIRKFESLMHPFVVRTWKPNWLGCHAVVITKFSFVSYESASNINSDAAQLWYDCHVKNLMQSPCWQNQSWSQKVTDKNFQKLKLFFAFAKTTRVAWIIRAESLNFMV